MSEEKFTFFWHGPFSQWHESGFQLDDIDYCCAEQYMMAQKALLFGDESTYEMIMDADDPSQHKKLGRLIDNFDVKIWQESDDNGYARCWNIVWRGNMAKFSQNAGLLQSLLATAGTTLVEASPYDKIWGIGLGEDAPDRLYRTSWRGWNWLGEVLTNVREQLINNPAVYDKSTDERQP